jgi:hypothetical protein
MHVSTRLSRRPINLFRRLLLFVRVAVVTMSEPRPPAAASDADAAVSVERT